jgi:flagellar biosynthesis protein FliQ
MADVKDAMATVLYVVVIALVVGILNATKQGVTFGGFGIDLTPLVGLTLGVALIAALLQAIDGIFATLKSLKTTITG